MICCLPSTIEKKDTAVRRERVDVLYLNVHGCVFCLGNRAAAEGGFERRARLLQPKWLHGMPLWPPEEDVCEDHQHK